jgi:hypothetical protein
VDIGFRVVLDHLGLSALTTRSFRPVILSWWVDTRSTYCYLLSLEAHPGTAPSRLPTGGDHRRLCQGAAVWPAASPAWRALPRRRLSQRQRGRAHGRSPGKPGVGRPGGGREAHPQAVDTSVAQGAQRPEGGAEPATCQRGSRPERSPWPTTRQRFAAGCNRTSWRWPAPTTQPDADCWTSLWPMMAGAWGRHLPETSRSWVWKRIGHKGTCGVRSSFSTSDLVVQQRKTGCIDRACRETTASRQARLLTSSPAAPPPISPRAAVPGSARTAACACSSPAAAGRR